MAQRKNITQPDEWWDAFILEANSKSMTLSGWMGECCIQSLTKSLPPRPPAHRPKKKDFTVQNPLLFENSETAFPLHDINSPTTHRARARTKTEIRDHRRSQTANEIISGLDKQTEIYGFTKGQFSLIDIIEAALKITGPADLTVSTWAAAKTSVNRILDFVNSGQCPSARWLIDLTLQRRLPELTKSIRDTFGNDAIRVGQNHAKFFMLRNTEWSIICLTSMNLNHNPRFENFLIRHDVPMCDFHTQIFDEIWKNQRPAMATMKSAVVSSHFRESM